MRRKSYQVEADEVGELGDRIADALDADVAYTGVDFSVLFAEVETESVAKPNVLVVVVVNRTDDRSAEVELVVGGGAGGRRSRTAGVEGETFAETVETIETTFVALGIGRSSAARASR